MTTPPAGRALLSAGAVDGPASRGDLKISWKSVALAEAKPIDIDDGFAEMMSGLLPSSTTFDLFVSPTRLKVRVPS